MLDDATKTRINSARDILVGKVPDPKSQVEQITIALIYKFMDDMDRQSEELGGKASFFSDGFKKYAWRKLIDPRLSGHERLLLYAEGLEKMNENKHIPQLFRDIFRGVFLPYRDPETLNLFLKQINEFSYEHSERLGDAFEYLLSVLGSQGDAGQFRTPRHIIDFIVSIVDPKKNDTVLDPACGTAGFLISAYKHILVANSKDGSGDLLSGDERGRLMDNFCGYDISPDMVRLSRANMYLHGFPQPRIHEYDTLTSEERWDERYDVIMANPPFMSPKGGIRPHNRFSIKATRSEVLFVDYIAEHLNVNGRAGVIVPEGIIFQSQNSYKTLRKMLVENALVAVVSLPAGCFNPYSGVKTSILILDKSLARQSDTIAFFKVDNDGFGLGAQRRAIEKNDLPQVQAELAAYLQSLRSRQRVTDLQPTCGLIVPKEKVAANGDYNLSGERYREGDIRSSNYPTVPIGEICELINGRAFKPEDWQRAGCGGLPIVRIQNLNTPDSEFNYYTGEVRDRFIVNEGELLFSWSGSRGTSFGAHIWKGGKAILNQHIFKVGFDESRATKMYLLHALNRAVVEVEENLHGGVGLVHITKGNLEKIQIPLPPLEVQKEIAAEIEGYQKVINGARAVLEGYRPHIPIHPDWPTVPLRDVCAIKSGGTPDRSDESFWNGDIPWVTTTLIDYGVIDRANEFITKEGLKNSSTWIVPKGTVLMAMYGQGVTRGRVAILGIDAAINQACAAFQIKGGSIDSGYLFRVLQSRYEDLRKISDARGGNQSNLSAQVLKDYSIPVPPLAMQQAIVAEIEAEQTLVGANRELISRFEQKIQATLARVWGEEEPLEERATA